MMDGRRNNDGTDPVGGKIELDRATAEDVLRVMRRVKREHEPNARVTEQTRRDADRIVGLFDKQLRRATDSKAS
jgi:hypothetical protein